MKGSEWVQAEIASQDFPLPIWEIQEAELINALHLKVFWKEITDAQAEEQLRVFQDRRRRGFYYIPNIYRIGLTDTFRQPSAETPRLGCRTMDILHVACAVQIAATKFLGFDKRQCALARLAGLNVV